MSYLSKISWTDSAGTHTFTFQYPARQIPAYSYKATRHDNIASSGVRESVYERVDKFTSLNMEFVATNTDIANWKSFMDYAIQGGSFQFYLDSSSTDFTNYYLEDKDWDATYKYPGIYTFKLTFREVVT